MSSRSIVRVAAQAARRPISYPSSSSSSLAVAARQLSTATKTLATLGKNTPRAAVAPIRQWTTTRRTYSQDSGSAAAPEGESKIWSFEDMKVLTSGGKSNIIIVDAREPGELQDTGRIPGAVNIPIVTQPDSFHIGEEEFEDRLGYPRPPKDAEVIFYCKAGVRSRAAAQLARSAGWTKTGEYPGSWLDWVEKGGRVQR